MTTDWNISSIFFLRFFHSNVTNLDRSGNEKSNLVENSKSDQCLHFQNRFFFLVNCWNNNNSKENILEVVLITTNSERCLH